MSVDMTALSKAVTEAKAAKSATQQLMEATRKAMFEQFPEGKLVTKEEKRYPYSGQVDTVTYWTDGVTKLKVNEGTTFIKLTPVYQVVKQYDTVGDKKPHAEKEFSLTSPTTPKRFADWLNVVRNWSLIDAERVLRDEQHRQEVSEQVKQLLIPKGSELRLKQERGWGDESPICKAVSPVTAEVDAPFIDPDHFRKVKLPYPCCASVSEVKTGLTVDVRVESLSVAQANAILLLVDHWRQDDAAWKEVDTKSE
jgi:hypothetical protein